MRTLTGWLLWMLVLVPNARAGEQDDARALVDQAIKAHGGAATLSKAQMLVRTGSGKLTQGNTTSAFTAETAWSMGDRLRLVMTFEKQLRVTLIVQGDKGWQSAGGPTMDLGAERVRELRDEAYVQWLLTLTPLQKDGVKLVPLPEIKVNGEPALGVQATRKDRPDVKLYFDKKTNLLVKIERRAKEGGEMLEKEYLFSEYKEFDGVKLPTAEVIQVNGRKSTELMGATYKVLKKVDEEMFVKP